MATQYALKAVTQDWHDPDVPQAQGDSFPGTALYTVGATITAPAAGQSPRPASFLTDFLTPTPLVRDGGVGGGYLTFAPRLGPLPPDALTAILAFDNPQYPWNEMAGTNNGIWPPGTGHYRAGHLLRLTYDDVTDLVVRDATAWGDAGNSVAEGGEGYTPVLLLRACYVDTEMILPSDSGGFILGSNDP